jgi:hypothetical protein
MKSSLSVIAAALLACVFVATPLARQQQMPVFRSEANYVEVTARVVDKDGKFIDGLTAKDFQITEDNRRANVEQLFRVDLPTPWTKATGAKPVMYRPGLANDLQVAEGPHLSDLSELDSRERRANHSNPGQGIRERVRAAGGRRRRLEHVRRGDIHERQSASEQED